MTDDFQTVRTGLSKKANDELRIPARYRGLSILNYTPAADELETAQRALAKCDGAFITGPCGAGKTHLSVAVLLSWYADALGKTSEFPQLQRPAAEGKFISTTDLIIELAEVKKNAESQLLTKYGALGLLAVDDLGAELSTKRQRHAIGALIDLRYRRMKPMIITSNLTLGDIAKLYDDRTASRLSGMCTLIELSGPDRRLPAKAFVPWRPLPQ